MAELDCRSFTVRLPESLVIAISNRAQASGQPRNTEIIMLLESGLSARAEEAEIISSFLLKTISPEELVRLGKLQ